MLMNSASKFPVYRFVNLIKYFSVQNPEKKNKKPLLRYSDNDGMVMLHHLNTWVTLHKGYMNYHE